MYKRHFGILLAAIASAGAALSCSSGSTTQTITPTAHSVTLANGVVSIGAGAWGTTQVNVTSGMLVPAVTGSFIASGGAGNDIKVYVMSATDYTNWSTGHSVTPLYNSGQLTTASFDVSLGIGTYYVVYDNSFSVISTKNVTTRVDLTYEQ